MAGAFISVTVNSDVTPLLAARDATSALSKAAENMSVSLKTASASSELVDAYIKKIAASAPAAAAGIRQVTNATAAARVEASAMTGSTGMLANSLARMVGQSSALGPLVEAAFPVFGALALGEVISSLGNSLDDFLQKPLKIRQEWQDVSDALVKENVAMEKSISDVIAKTIELEEGPIPALRYQLKLLGDSAGDLDEKIGKTFADIEKVLDESNLSMFDPLRMLGQGSADLRNQLKEALPDIQQTLNTDGAQAGLKKIDDLLTNLYQQRAAINKQAQTQEYDDAKLAALNKTIDAMVQIQTLTSRQADLNILDKQEKSAAIKNDFAEAKEELRDLSENMALSDKVARADLEASTKRLKAAEELTLAKLQGIELVAAAEGKANEAEIARQLEVRELSPNQAAARLRADETTQHTAKINELEGDLGAELGPAKLATFHAQMEAEEVRFRAAMAKINDDAARKSETLAEHEANEELETKLRSIQQLARISEERVSPAEVPAHGKGAGGREGVSPEQRAQQLLEIVQSATAKSEALIDAEIDAVSAMSGDNTAQLETLINKRVEIEQQAAEKIAQINATASREVSADWQRGLQAINGPLTSAVDGMINGTQRAEVAFARMGSSILTSGVNAILQWGLKTAEEFLIVEVLEHSSIARRVAASAAGITAKLSAQEAALTAEISTTVAGSAAKQSIVSSTNAAMVTGDAGAAGAAGFASVMEALPFPVNIAVAPGVAAAAVAETLGFLPIAIAERGAVFGNSEALTLAHPYEMMLPAPISRGAQKMFTAADKGDLGGGGDTHHHHNTYAPQISAIDSRGVADLLDKHSAEFFRMIRRGARNGQLSFSR